MTLPTRLKTDEHAWLTDERTLKVMAALNAERDRARFVGGCVRNSLQGQPVDDIDIATVLSPDSVIERCEAAGLKTVPTGMDHGTITVIAGHKPFEVTTLRQDVSTDGRRATIAYTENWAEDAARRDFTLNAIYASLDGTLYDFHDGIRAAQTGDVIFIGTPQTRLEEDWLRILRFYRFNAWYGQGRVDPTGHEACVRNTDKIWTLSAERIWKEFKKLLAAPDPVPVLRAMNESAVLIEILGQPASLERCAAMVAFDEQAGRQPDSLLRLACLLPERSNLLALAKRMRASNLETARLKMLFSDKAARHDTEGLDLKKALYRFGSETVIDQIRFDESTQTTDTPPRDLTSLQDYERPVFPISGNDLKAAGLTPGPGLGKAKTRLEDHWINSDFSLTREQLLARL